MACSTETPAPLVSDTSTTAATTTAATAPVNPLLGVQTLPIAGTPDSEITFSVISDHFAAEAPLSWSVIGGGVGNGNSLREGVVFFHYGQPINEPQPLMQEHVVSVELLDESTAKVSYDILNGPRAAGITIPGAATFKLNPQGTLDIIENTLPAVANEAGLQVDVSGLQSAS